MGKIIDFRPPRPPRNVREHAQELVGFVCEGFEPTDSAEDSDRRYYAWTYLNELIAGLIDGKDPRTADADAESCALADREESFQERIESGTDRTFEDFLREHRRWCDSDPAHS